jgi:hypothetical protein
LYRKIEDYKLEPKIKKNWDYFINKKI